MRRRWSAAAASCTDWARASHADDGVTMPAMPAPMTRQQPRRPVTGATSHRAIAATILRARPADARSLSALAMRSKSLWGYLTRFLAACRAELRVSPSALAGRDHICVVARIGTAVVGFCLLSRDARRTWEVDGLFVDPARIRRGIGRSLLRAACHRALRAGARTLSIQSDPHAEGFYRAMGAEPAGSRASASIHGRRLPLLQLRLDAPGARSRPHQRA